MIVKSMCVCLITHLYPLSILNEFIEIEMLLLSKR